MIMSREQIVQKYGAIDFASRHWPEQSRWIKLFEVPQGVFPHWFVMNTKVPVQHIACNIDMHEPLKRALSNVVDAGRAAELHTFDGCFNIRLVRGSNTHFSAHSYGLALDLNAGTNPMGSKLRTDFSPEFVAAFKSAGFYWGGEFHGRKDPMHWGIVNL